MSNHASRVRRKTAIRERRLREMFVVPKPFQWEGDVSQYTYDPIYFLSHGDWITETERGYRLVRRKNEE